MGSNRTHVLIIGPQGSGKGTQAAVVAPQLGLVHVATGDLFRALMASDNELAREVRSYYDRGALVPDDLTVRVLVARLDELDRQQPDYRGVLLDGFPRNRAQAEALDRVLRERGDNLVAVIHLVVPREALIERLSGRLVCQQCGATYHRVFNPPRQEGICDRCGGPLIQRSDDTPEAIARRLDIYEEQTAPLLEYYRQRGLLVDIDGDRPIEEVSQSILAALVSRLGA
ncbi:adenylate kinase [Thermomicrobiaceae bacterium CFH 74404]|uniref:Adenylate kinase n=1 Tax=Thermalbibacter longus TaxID=2951981 RepID=A0AA41WCC5_9BACT|nr:adenylate kinase [Thermalbibacter longus]MCM8750559.1 adenylate kinase [Thermalbibacter longus]